MAPHEYGQLGRGEAPANTFPPKKLSPGVSGLGTAGKTPPP